MQWNATGVTVAGTTGVNGSALNLLNTPMGISVALNDSSLYIADMGNQRIVKWTLGAANGILIASSSQLSKPTGVFADSMQNLYVSDSGNSRIRCFPSGSGTGTTCSSGWVALDKPYCVYMKNNMIYTCDNGRNVIVRNGSEAAGKGSGATGEIQHSYGLVVDDNDTMYIANFDHHVIVAWPMTTASTSAGTIVAGSLVGTAGSTSSLLHSPASVARDSQGNLYVVDQANHRIQLFCKYPTSSMNGITIAGTGTAGSLSTELSSPTGIALDSSLNVYVSDTGNARVQMFQRIA